MPALRKRDRQSRTGTPLATPADTPTQTSDQSKQKLQSSLDAWIEPAPQNPTPSFEEHGFARHGVLETMAPLGSRPTSKAKQKARALTETISRRLSGRKSNAFVGEEEGSTPELTPAPELDRDDSERQDDDDIHATYPEQDEDEDDDYIPTKKKAKTSHGTKTPIRGKGAAHGKSGAHTKTPVKNGINKPSAAYTDTADQLTPLNKMDDATKQRIQIAVNDAIGRANRQDKRSVGIAIKELYESSRTDAHLAKALDGVIHQKETAEDWGFFRNFIKATKKRIKRQTKIQQALETQSAPGVSVFTDVPEVVSPTPGSDLALNDSVSATLELEPSAPATKASAKLNGVAEKESSAPVFPVNLEPAGAAPHPLTTALAFPVTEQFSAPATRMSSKSPRKQQKHPIAKGNLAPESEAAEASTSAPTPAVKTPDSGALSDSDLSDVNEEILQQPQPTPAPAPAAVYVNGSGAAAVLKKPKNANVARAGKKSRANSMKPWGKQKEKPQPTAEELVEQEELQQKRMAMSEGQSALMNMDAPVSDLRFDDEMLETESLTESQIAVGPPVDANRPRRAGRPPRNGAKRPRDDRFSSPRLDSASTTRPSTPAVIHVPNKRIKLNNGQSQSARTKKSPVKNRDGPIAGIPHAGGGGSRQSGPDDNEPGSPPSESDDICSACRGAGEFVCCDNCPRVFHFLCCDPPRLDAPQGSFLCHECTAKLKPIEESTVEPHPVLSPLFKSLDSINPRAFALPSDIQRHFEDVAARPDGSYSEEIKKFPLAKSSGYGYQKPDYTKVFDGDHKPILCVSCGCTSGGKRQMLKCDFCNARWHLDCLDPPMANPPHINLETSHRDAWRCPRHIEHDLRSGYVLQNDLNEVQEDAIVVDAPTARLGRKVRKPRHPRIVDSTFTRGMRNNGLIEIINDADDDTDGEGNYVFGAEDKDANSNVYRVPEKGVILDFVDKVRGNRITKKLTSAAAAAARKSSMQTFAARPIEQQQAALNLAILAKKEKEVGLGDASLLSLYVALTAEAPDQVVSAISDAAPPPLTDRERAQLVKLQELIKLRLGG